MPVGGADRVPLTKELPNPTLLMLSTQKGAKALGGRTDGTGREGRGTDCTQGT